MILVLPLKLQSPVESMTRINKTAGIYYPPADFNKRTLLIKRLKCPLYRIFRIIQVSQKGKAGILHFGLGTGRFNAPNKAYGVCYFGADEYAAFIETCGRQRHRLLDELFLSQLAIATINVLRPLKLVDISGAGAAWVGAAGEISAGDHVLSQLWSKAFYEHPNKPDGIYYRCRHDLERYSIALFARGKNLLQVSTYTGLMSTEYRANLATLLDYYSFSLLPTASD